MEENLNTNLEKKQLFYQRVCALCLAGMLVVLTTAVVIMVPKVTTTLNHINNVAIKAEESLGNRSTCPRTTRNY